MTDLPQKWLRKIILEHHEQRKQNWMLSADPSKIILTPGLPILPAAKSEALGLIHRLERSQICFASGSKTPHLDVSTPNLDLESYL